MMPTDDGERAAIEITAPTLAQAERLAAKMNGFETEVVPWGSYTVRSHRKGRRESGSSRSSTRSAAG